MTEAPAVVPRCSAESERLDEPVLGTASVVRTWLMLEHPGSWSPTALHSRRLPPGVGRELARRANRHRVRIVLVRRSGRTAPDLPPTCFAARTGPGGSWLGTRTLDRMEDVLDLDLGALAVGSTDGFAPLDGPLLCVCTHGSHDPCCAERGRPVASALAARFPEQTWEVSHIGGDRFAGNVVCFPGGEYLGRLDASTAVPVVQAYLAGSTSSMHLRGRAGFSPVVQAAEILVRQRLGVTARDGVRVLSSATDSDGTTVRLEIHGHGVLAATVSVRPADPTRAADLHRAAPGRPADVPAGPACPCRQPQPARRGRWLRSEPAPLVEVRAQRASKPGSRCGRWSVARRWW